MCLTWPNFSKVIERLYLFLSACRWFSLGVNCYFKYNPLRVFQLCSKTCLKLNDMICETQWSVYWNYWKFRRPQFKNKVSFSSKRERLWY